MTLFLTRHASAGTRAPGGDDLLRPLDELGRAQADAVAELLGDRGVDRILTSRATRCAQTVAPLARLLGLEVEEHPALVEGQSAVAALDLCRTLARDGVTAVLGSHGDIIPDTIQTLAREGLVISGVRGWSKGSTWELEVRGADLVRATFLGPF